MTSVDKGPGTNAASAISPRATIPDLSPKHRSKRVWFVQPAGGAPMGCSGSTLGALPSGLVEVGIGVETGALAVEVGFGVPADDGAAGFSDEPSGVFTQPQSATVTATRTAVDLNAYLAIFRVSFRLDVLNPGEGTTQKPGWYAAPVTGVTTRARHCRTIWHYWLGVDPPKARCPANTRRTRPCR
jgi:hypothetical protein